MVTVKEKRSFILLAKVVQNIANGSVGSIKWPLLQSKMEFLKECSNRIFDFLADVSRADRVVKISVKTDKKVTLEDFNFMHEYMYLSLIHI